MTTAPAATRLDRPASVTTATARVAITALAAVHVLGALPNLVLSFGSGPDPVLLAYSISEVALVGAVALLGTSSARAWFGPAT